MTELDIATALMQLGGLGAFAAYVAWQLKHMRTEAREDRQETAAQIKTQNDELKEQTRILARLEERTRRIQRTTGTPLTPPYGVSTKE